MEKNVSVSITANTVITALLICFGAYLLWLLRDLTLLVLTAIVIASSIEPGISFFIRHRIPRVFAALLMYVLVFGSVFLLLFFFLPPIISDTVSFAATIPSHLNNLNIPEPITSVANASGMFLGEHEEQSFMQTLASLQTIFSATGSSGVVQLVSAFFGGIFSLLLVIVLSFYFALQDTGVDDFLRLILPVSYEEYAVDLWKRAQKKIGLWMQGQILLSVIVGILVYLGLLIIGVPYALLLAVFTAFAEIIPIFGSLAAGAAGVAVAFSQGGVALGAIVAGLYIVVNQFESNLIYPLIVKKVVGVPPLLVIVALIAGFTLAGFLGALLSVPISAVALEFLADYDKHKRRISRTS
jgi:predicted PurR-regulated permease PerM